MTAANPEFRLKVSCFESICQFELTWGEAQSVTARSNYPVTLDALYRDWRKAYLNFYQSQPSLSMQPSEGQGNPSPMRAHVANTGSVTPKITDWRAELNDAEIALLTEFRNWLCQGELRDIRKVLADASRSLPVPGTTQGLIEVFLTCDPIDLVRLPWETWEITDDLAAVGRIRIVRSPSTIRDKPTLVQSRKRVRILAICCDDVGLNLSREKHILKSLEPLVYIKTIGWANESENISAAPEQVQQEIIEAITDEAGWDMLFFAGHSDETRVTGGKLAIAPDTYITIEALKPALTAAKQQGLQLAIFNSCNGLRIAEALIDLGLREVVVMRERIHNQVAQAFLVQVARSLRAYKDAQEAVYDATQLLLNRWLDYPSAYLVPSVFRRPGAASFVLTRPGWRQWMAGLRPKRWEWATVALLSVASLTTPIQLGLLDYRVLGQAQYRQLTDQVDIQTPALALIRIDDESIERDKQTSQDISSYTVPMSQKYIGKLVQSLIQKNVKVIGIDYVLDYTDPRTADNTIFLEQVIKQAISQNQRFVFAEIQSPNSSVWLRSLPALTQSPSVGAAAIRSVGDNFHLPLQSNFGTSDLSLSYWLAWFHHACVEQSTDGCAALTFDQQSALAHRYAAAHLPQLYRPRLGEMLDSFTAPLSVYPLWFHAITDFSIPPEQAYREIPAWTLLEPSAGVNADAETAAALASLANQTALITAGGYPAAGISPTDNGAGYVENFVPPHAMRHWYSRDPELRYRRMTGGEHLGYVFHHFLNRRFVVPVPDLLMVGLAAVVGKLVAMRLQNQAGSSSTRQLSLRSPSLLYLVSGTLAYGLISFQLYISAAILLPILLPAITVWAYVLPRLLPRLPR